MYKKTTVLLCLLLVIFGLYFYNINRASRKNSDSLNKKDSQVISESAEGSGDINLSDISYSLGIFNIDDTNKLQLFPNWVEKKTSDEFLDLNKCLFLVSGGFYSKDEKPIGLFSIGNTIYSKFIKNNVINGIFYKDLNGRVIISDTPPTNQTSFSLQTGPIVVKNSIFINLNEYNADSGRRVLAIKTTDHQLFYVVIYNKNSLFEGPTISELPSLLKTLANNQGWEISDAINLDGGTASVFIGDTYNLKELSPVGSFFCYKY